MRVQFIRPATLVLFAGAGAFALALGMQPSGSAAPRSLPAAAMPVEIVTIEHSSSFESARIFTGQVEARRRSSLGFERSAKLISVAVREGANVGAGEVLATLDQAALRATRSELEAALAAAQAELTLATATRIRFEDSVVRGAVTRQALDEAREGERARQANVELAEARLATLAVAFDQSRIVAPFDAVVVERHMDEGQVVATGAPVLTVQERVAPEIRIGVAADLAGRFSPGAEHKLNTSVGAVVATVRAALPLRSATTRTVDVIFELRDATMPLRDGDLVEIALSSPIQESGIWLPVSALAEAHRGLWQVYALARTKTGGFVTEARAVEVLHLSGDRVYVRGALANGERVVRAGLHRVVAGQSVAPATHRVASR
ncbi:MAG: efflux RND transporter periplasmic adaptor subunit [Pseudomonadota bacterium]